MFAPRAQAGEEWCFLRQFFLLLFMIIDVMCCSLGAVESARGALERVVQAYVDDKGVRA